MFTFLIQVSKWKIFCAHISVVINKQSSNQVQLGCKDFHQVSFFLSSRQKSGPKKVTACWNLFSLQLVFHSLHFNDWFGKHLTLSWVNPRAQLKHSLFSMFPSSCVDADLFAVSPAEEAALVLGRDTVLLTQIMDWCETKEHGGVKGEASRLLAALIRHSRSPVSCRTHLVWRYSTHSSLLLSCQTGSGWCRCKGRRSSAPDLNGHKRACHHAKRGPGCSGHRICCWYW